MERRTPERFLFRRRGAGPPVKAPALRDALCQWFIDIRFSLAAAISPRAVLARAKLLAKELVAEMQRLGLGTESASARFKFQVFSLTHFTRVTRVNWFGRLGQVNRLSWPRRLMWLC